MNHGRFNPIRLVAALTGLCLFVGAAVNPALFRLDAPDAAAVGGYVGVDTLGQLTGADEPDFDHEGVNNSPNSRGFSGPTSVAIDTVNHRLFVSDYDNNRVLIFNLDVSNQLEDRIADNVLGQPDFRENGGETTQNGFDQVGDIAYDEAGQRLFVGEYEGRRVMVFDVASITDGENAENVIGQEDFTSNVDATTQDGIGGVGGLVYDPDNQRLFVADQSHNRILVFDVTTVDNGEDAIHVLGQTDYVTGDSGTSADKFINNDSMAYDSGDDRLFVADYNNNRVMVFDVTTIDDGEDAINVLGQETFDFPALDPALTRDGMNNPSGVAYDPINDRLFVSDESANRVLIHDVSAIVNGQDADNVLGQPDFTSANDGTGTQAGLVFPTGLAYDPGNQYLYVPDGTTRVSVFNVSAIIDGEDAIDLLGQLDENDAPVYTAFGGDNAPNAQGLNHAEGMAMDRVNHRLYVADTNNNRVLMYELDVANHLVDHTADIVIGQPDFKTTNPALTAEGLSGPQGIAIDPNNRLFITDTDHARVLIYDTLVLANGMPASNVIGAPDFTSNDAGEGLHQFTTPQDVDYDAVNQRLFVADVSNKVRVFDLSGGVTNGIAAVNRLGSEDWLFASDAPARSFVEDPVNEILYAGGETITRCILTTLCDEDADWSVSHSAPGGVNGMALDSGNSILYAATGTDGIVLRCVIASGCDEDTDWTTAFNSTEFSINAIIYDDANDVLYVGTSSTGLIYRCITSTGCDDGGDWTLAFTMAVEGFGGRVVTAFAIDTTHSVIYAVGFGGTFGHLFRCELSVGCDAQGEWTDSFTDATHALTTVMFEPVLGMLYLGNNEAPPPAKLRRCDTNVSGSCDDSTDWSIIYDTGDNTVISLAFDSVSDAIYMSTSNSIVRCDITTGCDDGEDWVRSRSGNNFRLFFDPINEAMYVDTFDDIYRCAIATGCLADGILNAPSGVTYDGDNQRLFVAEDCGDVKVFDVSSIDDNENWTYSLIGFASCGGGTNLHMAYDGAGNRLFASDLTGNRVLVFDVNPATLTDGEEPYDVVGQDNLGDTGTALDDEHVSEPQSVLLGPDEQLYVADRDHNRIMVFDLTGGGGGPTLSHEATDVIGQLDDSDEPLFTSGGADNGPNRRGSSQPIGIAVDHVNHRLFASDYDNGRVLMYNLDITNTLVDRVADAVIGHSDFKEEGCGDGPDHICNPNGLALDEDAGLLFVASYGGNRVLVFDVNEVESGEDAIHVLGQPDFDSNGQVTSQTGMSNPNGVEWYEEDQELFVADGSNNRVLVFDLSGGITDGMPASHVLGQPDFNTNTPVLSAAGMEFASDIEYVGALPPSGLEHLYVSDRQHCRVLAFDISTIDDGEDADLVLGQPDFTTADCGTDSDSLLATAGLSHDEANGLLFVTDFQNNRVMVWDVNEVDNHEPATMVIGQPNFNSSGAVVSQNGLSDPEGVYYDDEQALLYVTDTGAHRVLIYDGEALSDGVAAIDGFSQLNPDDTPNYTAGKPNNGPNTQGFDSPGGVALDVIHHRLFVTDFFNNRILVFTLDDGNVLTDRTADFVIGQPDFKSNQNAGGDPQAYNFENGPQSVVYDPANDRLYANDANGNRILIFDTTIISNGMSAAFVLGQPDFTTHDCCATDASHFVSSEGIALDDPNSRLYVPDGFHNRVLVFDVSTISNGEPAVGVLGQSDFTSDFPGSGAAGMDGPGGATVDVDEQRVFVTDSNNHRILVFDLNDGIDDDITDGEDAINVLGQDDFSSNGSNLSQNGLSGPRSPLFEGDGPAPLLYVPDVNNNRVMVFDVSTIDDGENATDAYGQPDFETGDCGTSASELCVPHGVVHDADLDILYVADADNNRVLLFGPTPTPTPGGGGGSPPTPVGFTPGRIIVNDDDSTTNSRNVLVDVYATTTGNFVGTVDVLLSNTTDFSTFVPFRYVIPERLPNGNNTRDIWPKTIAWDLCFGITDTTQCRLGIHTVYARFYVNVPAPSPVLVRPDGGNMVSSQ